MKNSLHLSRTLLALAGLTLLGRPAAAQPRITQLSPAAGAAGSTVTITGSNFAPTAAQNAVYFGTGRATVTAATAGQLTVQVPAGASSIAPVTVADLRGPLAGSSLYSTTTPFFTVTFPGPGLNANSYLPTVYPVATSRLGLSSLTTADLNADNFPDFALVAEGLLRLLLSDGQGGYLPLVGLPAGASPGFVRAADVTGDGAADLLLASGSGLLLYRNLGNGNGFATASSVNLGGLSVGGTAFFSIEVQDLDGDGRPDLLLPALNGSTLQQVTLRNNGAGFDAPVLRLAQFGQPVVADFTGDGQPDILVVASAPGGLSPQLALLARNVANTDYETPLRLDLPPGLFPGGGVRVADFNADGRPDVALAVTGGVLVALRTATSFQYSGPFVAPGPPGAGPTLADVADLDGDGRPDAVVAGASNAFSVLRGQTGGSLASPISYGQAGSPVTVVTGDFDRDGRPADVANFDQTSGNLTIYRYTGATAAAGNAPTLDPLADLSLPLNAPQQSIPLTGISSGGAAGLPITVTATSSDPGLVPNPTVSYFSPTTTGTLRLQPAPNVGGTCLITVTVSNGQPQNGSFSRSFRVTVNGGIGLPTLDPIPDVVFTNVPSTGLTLTVPLSGITAGSPALPAALSQTTTWNIIPPNVIATDGIVTYASPATTGQYRLLFSTGYVQYLPPAGGLVATVTITVSNGQAPNGSVSRTFRVFYNPTGAPVANVPPSAPTLDPIADVLVDRQNPPGPVALTGISDGDPNQMLPLTVTTSSADPGLVSLGPVNYTSPAATGSLPFTFSASRGGTAVVSVTVSNGLTPNGTITRTFRVTVPAPAPLAAAGARAGGAEFAVFPNPTEPGGRFQVSYPSGETLTLTVSDLRGREIWRQVLSASGAAQALALPAGTAAGLYLLRGESTRGSTVRRLVVP